MMLVADQPCCCWARVGSHACIRTVALQGVLLGLLPLVRAAAADSRCRSLALAAGTVAIKGVVFPWLLLRAVREADVRREVEPLVGLHPSLLIGMLACWRWPCALSGRLPLPAPAVAAVARARGAVHDSGRACS